MSVLRRGVVALLTAVLAVPLATVPAQAAETVLRPGSGRLTVEGHGYGHGRGMSQWGAYGAANKGLSWQQILDFYYPGTIQRAEADTPIRVQISADNDNAVEVHPMAGLVLTSGDLVAELPTGSRYDSWRVVRTTAGLELQRLDEGQWGPFYPAGTLGTDATFTSTTGLVRLVLPNGVRRELRDSVRAVPEGTGTRLHAVAVMGMEDYLRGVVPREMPPSWAPEAVRAQAVAARTYAARLRSGASARLWDTCDTTACQVFYGTAEYDAQGTLIRSNEHPSSDAAIAATAGTVLYFRTASGTEQLALTEFSASNGGWTAPGSSAHPYFVAKEDPYDGRMANPNSTWRRTVEVSRIEAKWPAIGSLRQISVDRRNGYGDYGGRVLAMTLTGSRGSVTVTGDQFRTAMNESGNPFRSNWFRFTDVAAFPRDFSGDGLADILVTEPSGPLWLHRGDGTGALTSRARIGWGWYTRNLIGQVGDWDGDRTQDILARDPVTGNLWLYRGDGSGGFGKQGSIGGKWWSVNAMLGVGDWDGDTRSDVLARLKADGSLWLYPGNGSGGWLPARQVGRGWAGMDLLTAAGDLTGDGKPDVVARVAGTGELRVYPGNGSGAFQRPYVVPGDYRGLAQLAPLGDHDGDGYHDLLALTTTGELRLYPGTPDGYLETPRTLATGWDGFSLIP